MNKFLSVMTCLLTIIYSHCREKTSYDFVEIHENRLQPVDIHWGTKLNTLHGVTLSWISAGKNDSIRWGYSTSYEFGKFAGISTPGYLDYHYEFTFPILNPSSLIHYSIKTGERWTNDRIYCTATDTSSSRFSFTIGGDSHCGKNQFSNERWQLISNRLAEENIDFHLLLGDVVHRGYDISHWKDFLDYGRNFTENKLIFYTWGNHDYHALALDNFVLPGNKKWYSFSQKNALFICLLSEEDFDSQYLWLVEQLKQADQEWIFIFFHRPFFTRGTHKDEMNKLRTTWWKTFDDYGVDIVMNGHTHSYIRTIPLNLNVTDIYSVSEYGSRSDQGRLQFVSGGLGGDNSIASEDWFATKAYSGLHYIKFQVDNDYLHFETFTETGALIDSLTMYSEGTHYKKFW